MGIGISSTGGGYTKRAADARFALKNTNAYVIAEPGDNLTAKYAQAKALTPNGSALSSTNRAALVIMPGNYTIAAQLAIDAEFVDLIGLGSIKLRRGSVPAVIIGGNNLNVTANNVRVKGISVGTQSFAIGQSNLSLQVIEDCAGGDNSFNAIILAGTFINCTGGSTSFASSGFVSMTASGTFINCAAGGSSFGHSNSGGVASGLFVNCVVETGSTSGFGGGTASGTFIDCEAGSYSFGTYFFGGTVASGTFINCTSTGNAFANNAGGSPSGKFYRCRLTSGTFKTVASGGLMRNCIDGNNDIIDQ